MELPRNARSRLDLQDASMELGETGGRRGGCVFAKPRGPGEFLGCFFFKRKCTPSVYLYDVLKRLVMISAAPR